MFATISGLDGGYSDGLLCDTQMTVQKSILRAIWL